VRRVREGQSFSSALLALGVFPDVAVKMVEVGESTGALQEMLTSLADFYDEEIDTEVARFIALVEARASRRHGCRHRVRGACAVPAAVRAELGGHGVAGGRKDRRCHQSTNRDRPDPGGYSAEIARARALARAVPLEFVDMDEFRDRSGAVQGIPADLMLRYGFVPYRREGRSLVIVVSDPTDLPMIDELGVILARRSR
jgi:hypothetical protein